METLKTLLASSTEIQQGVEFLKDIELTYIPAVVAAIPLSITMYAAKKRHLNTISAAAGFALAGVAVGAVLNTYLAQEKISEASQPSFKAAALYTTACSTDKEFQGKKGFLNFPITFTNAVNELKKQNPKESSKSDAIVLTHALMKAIYGDQKVSVTTLDETLKKGADIATAYYGNETKESQTVSNLYQATHEILNTKVDASLFSARLPESKLWKQAKQRSR